MEEGEETRILRITEEAEENSDLMHLLHENRLLPGVAIKLTSVNDVELTLEREDAADSVVISQDLARYVAASKNRCRNVADQMKVAVVTGAGSGVGARDGGDPARQRVRRGAGRAAPRGAGRERGVDSGTGEDPGGADGRRRPGVGTGAVRRNLRQLRPRRPGVQQCRDGGPTGAARGSQPRGLATGGGYQPDRFLPLHPGGVPGS